MPRTAQTLDEAIDLSITSSTHPTLPPTPPATPSTSEIPVRSIGRGRGLMFLDPPMGLGAEADAYLRRGPQNPPLAFGLGRGKSLLNQASTSASDLDTESDDDVTSGSTWPLDAYTATKYSTISDSEEDADDENESEFRPVDDGWDSEEEKYWVKFKTSLPPLPTKRPVEHVDVPEDWTPKKKMARPPLPAMDIATRDAFRTYNFWRYHHAAYELQEEFWAEEKNIEKAYQQHLEETWGVERYTPPPDELQKIVNTL